MYFSVKVSNDSKFFKLNSRYTKHSYCTGSHEAHITLTGCDGYGVFVIWSFNLYFLYLYIIRKNVCQFTLAETVYSLESSTATELYVREVCCKKFGGCWKKCKRNG